MQCWEDGGWIVEEIEAELLERELGMEGGASAFELFGSGSGQGDTDAGQRSTRSRNGQAGVVDWKGHGMCKVQPIVSERIERNN